MAIASKTFCDNWCAS